MNASELRKNNYVLWDGEFVQGITTNSIHLLDTGTIKGTIEPIPLTEEWLLKFESKKSTDEFGGWLLKISETESIRITIAKSATFAWPLYGHSIVKLNYVHQLQNLYFALTQKELSYKNQ